MPTPHLQQPAPSPLPELHQLLGRDSPSVAPVAGSSADATARPGRLPAPGATAALADLLAGSSGTPGADGSAATSAGPPAEPAEAMQVEEGKPPPALLLQQQLMQQQAAAALAAGGTLPWK